MGELTNFISNSYLFQDIFLDMGSYTNELVHLSLVCTCLTDVTYWQFTLVFKRWRRDKSQLLIHNRGLRQCHSFTGRSPIFLYEQLKLAGAASGLPGDHGPANSLSFIFLFSAICLLTVRLVVTNPAVRCGTCSGSFRHHSLSIFHSSFSTDGFHCPPCPCHLVPRRRYK